MAEFKVELSEEDIESLRDLVKRRGISANKVLKQAIATEKLIADNVGEKDDLLIKKGDTYKKVIFR